MDLNHVNHLARTVTSRLTRRTALRGLGGLAATGLAGAGLHRAVAQGGTLEASPVASPVTDTPGFGQEFLFVQTAEAGTWQPKPDADGIYTLTLTGAAAQTIYFSDRPERIAGAVPMQAFLDGLGFTPDNPPNAALVTGSGDDEDVLVIELRNPVYDAGADALTYEAVVLEGYAEAGLAFVAERQEDDALPATFGHTSLFIDDCPDLTSCTIEISYEPEFPAARAIGQIPGGPYGLCWSWKRVTCAPCSGESFTYYTDLCNQEYPDCGGDCYVG